MLHLNQLLTISKNKLSERITMKTLSKIGLVAKNVLIYLFLRLFSNVQILGLGWFRGKLSISLEKNARCIMGKHIITMGPLYIKCIEEGGLKIGADCFFNHNCSITCAESITIGDGCNIANNVVIVDHDHLVTSFGVEGTLVTKPVSIGNSVWIGANVTILKGVNIGEGAVIAANSVVRNDVAPHSMVAGVPARFIKRIV